MKISLLTNQFQVNQQNLPHLPRFNRQFIGISHQLQQKKKERLQMEQQQKSLANRVLYLQKQEFRTQRTLNKKKSQLTDMLKILDYKNNHLLQKQRQRKIKQVKQDQLRQQNRQKKQTNIQNKMNKLNQLQKQKHQDYLKMKVLIQNKQSEKNQFLNQDIRNKKEKCMNINVGKQRGKSNIDNFYKRKNQQHTQHYMSMIQKQQQSKLQKINTIKHLQVFQSALKKKLQQNTMKVSEMNNIIMRTSKTIQKKDQLPILNRKKTMNPQINYSQHYKRRQITRTSTDNHLMNNSFEGNNFTKSQKNQYFTQRYLQNQQQIQQNIQTGLQGNETSTFKIIRTRRRRNNKNQTVQTVQI